EPGNHPHPPHRFTKGQSGNPRGVPTWVRKIRKLAGKHSEKALLTLVDMLASPRHAIRVRAAEAILDRAGLKPFSLEGDKLEVVLRDEGDPINRLSALLARR